MLRTLKREGRKHGGLLIFEEVSSGVRASVGGGQALFGVRPDLTTLGKRLGGGLPVGAYGGRKEIMQKVSPLGPVYQAGTLSGNPLAMASGAATLRALNKGLTPPKKVGRKSFRSIYAYLDALGAKLEEGLREEAVRAGIPVVVNRFGSLLTVFFTERKCVENYEGAQSSDPRRFARFFRAMLEQGIYLPPSQFEAWFLSAEHSERDVRRTLRAARGAFLRVKRGQARPVSLRKMGH